MRTAEPLSDTRAAACSMQKSLLVLSSVQTAALHLEQHCYIHPLFENACLWCPQNLTACPSDKDLLRWEKVQTELL